MSAPQLREEVADLYLNLFELKNTGEQYESLLASFLREDDPFYDLIFSAEGTYAQKEKIDQALEALHRENESCYQKINYHSGEIKKCQQEVSRGKQQLADIEINQAALDQSIELNVRIKDEKVANTNSLEVQYVPRKAMWPSNKNY